ncbi:MAG: hypothetical protein LBM21_01645, partial [Coriobacteriales bacterium]|nr:hypothetical protein [Coriobacteriales bacterium]
MEVKRRGGISALKAPAIRGFVASILALCLVVSLLLTGIDGFVRPAGIRSAYASTGKVNTGSIGFAYSSNNDFSVTSEAAGGGNGDIDEDTTAHVATIQHDGTYSISTDAESDSSIGSDHAIMIASGVNATLKVTGDVDCEPTTAAVSGIEVGGTQAATGTALTLNVDNGVTLTVQSAVPTQSNTGLAAIHVSGNATLTIQGSGTVYATAQGGVAGSDATGQTSSSSDVFGSGAAIGSNSAEDAKAGAITIGGSVTVDAAAASQNEYVGAAIGGGGAYEDTNASASSQASSPASALYGCVSTIAINDAADVIAISSASSHSGSGIGAGAFGNGASAGNITISTTGTVVASSLLSGDDGSDALCASAGIGTYPGWLAGTNDASAITIKSGNVYAYGADASTGATEVPNSIYPQPTSDGTTLVYPVYVPSVLNNGSVDTPTADVTFSCDGYSATANAGIATGNVVDLSSVLPGNVDTFLGLSKENTGLATDADCVMWLPSTTSATTT